MLLILLPLKKTKNKKQTLSFLIHFSPVLSIQLLASCSILPPSLTPFTPSLYVIHLIFLAISFSSIFIFLIFVPLFSLHQLIYSFNLQHFLFLYILSHLSLSLSLNSSLSYLSFNLFFSSVSTPYLVPSHAVRSAVFLLTLHGPMWCGGKGSCLTPCFIAKSLYLKPILSEKPL